MRTRNGVFTLDRFQALIRAIQLAGARFQERTQRFSVAFKRFDGRFSIAIEVGESVAFACRLIQLRTNNGVFTLDRFQALIRSVQLVGQGFEARSQRFSVAFKRFDGRFSVAIEAGKRMMFVREQFKTGRRECVFMLGHSQALICTFKFSRKRIQARKERGAVAFERFDGRIAIAFKVGEPGFHQRELSMKDNLGNLIAAIEFDEPRGKSVAFDQGRFGGCDGLVAFAFQIRATCFSVLDFVGQDEHFGLAIVPFEFVEPRGESVAFDQGRFGGCDGLVAFAFQIRATCFSVLDFVGQDEHLGLPIIPFAVEDRERLALRFARPPPIPFGVAPSAPP